MSEKITKQNFQPLINSSFTLTFDPQNSYEVELVKIIDGPPIPSMNLEPFTLVFRGDRASTIYDQGTYQLSSEKIGSLSLFFVPRQPDDNGIYYDVMIN